MRSVHGESHQGQVKFYLKIPYNKKQNHTSAVDCFVTTRINNEHPARVWEIKESFFLKVTDFTVVSKWKINNILRGAPQRKHLDSPKPGAEVDVLWQRGRGRGKEGEERRTRLDNGEELWRSSPFAAFRFCQEKRIHNNYQLQFYAIIFYKVVKSLNYSIKNKQGYQNLPMLSITSRTFCLSADANNPKFTKFYMTSF